MCVCAVQVSETVFVASNTEEMRTLLMACLCASALVKARGGLTFSLQTTEQARGRWRMAHTDHARAGTAGRGQQERK